MSDLLILAHGGSWELRFQASSLAACAVAGGRRVDLALFFAALDHWVGGRWDELDPEPPLSAATLAAQGAPSLTDMLRSARARGGLRLYACSASVRFLRLETAAVQAAVDLVAGWQTFTKLALEAETVVTL